MKNTNLQLPDLFDNYIKEAGSTDITVAVEDTCIIIACRCIINGRHYTASARCRVKDRMSKILHKIASCLDEIKDTYSLDKPKPKTTRKETVPENGITVEPQLKPKHTHSMKKDSPTLMVAGVTLQTLSEKVRINRHARKLGTKKYAKNLGISTSTLWYLENCERMPRNPDTVRRILNYTNGKSV